MLPSIGTGGTSRLIAAIKEVREDLEVALCLVMEINVATVFGTAMLKNTLPPIFVVRIPFFLKSFLAPAKKQACHGMPLHFSEKICANARPNFPRTSSGQLKVLQNADTLEESAFDSSFLVIFVKKSFISFDFQTIYSPQKAQRVLMMG